MSLLLWTDQKRVGSRLHWYKEGLERMMSPEERATILLEAAPNTWIALSGDESRVVGRGASYEDAVKMAEQAGEDDPLLIKTPDEWVPMVL